MLLTPQEYDQLPAEVQAQLAAVHRHPRHDVKSNAYRRRRGAFLNGELYADAQALGTVGYGTGSPLAPHSVATFPESDSYPGPNPPLGG